MGINLGEGLGVNQWSGGGWGWDRADSVCVIGCLSFLMLVAGFLLDLAVDQLLHCYYPAFVCCSELWW